ncbi:hypothetical protein RB195_024813 [Necator americanus]|uniref:Reverse transcriptase domain-containing protein n=2 Tax=Necator americanus TaxID=51031 RepID=A0ABR1EPP0_NECAM
MSLVLLLLADHTFQAQCSTTVESRESTIGRIHTVSKLEVSREHKMPLCLTFIDLKKAFHSIETEAVMEALDNQGVPTQYVKLNMKKAMFMRNGWVSDAPFTLNETNVSECTSYVYLSRKLNMMNDLIPELDRTRRAAWEAYRNIEDVVKKTKNTQLRGHLFNTTVLLVLTYASETWALRKQENAMSVIESTVERVMQGVSSFTQVTGGI